MEHRKNLDMLGFWQVEQRVGKALQELAAHLASDPWGLLWIAGDLGHRGVDAGAELVAQPLALCLLPSPGFGRLIERLGFVRHL